MILVGQPGPSVQNPEYALVSIRDITGHGGEPEIGAFGQDDRSLETFLPRVRLFRLQFDKKSRLGFHIGDSTLCWDVFTSELFLQSQP